MSSCSSAKSDQFPSRKVNIVEHCPWKGGGGAWKDAQMAKFCAEGGPLGGLLSHCASCEESNFLARTDIVLILATSRKQTNSFFVQ